jgi:hypothetical protein
VAWFLRLLVAVRRIDDHHHEPHLAGPGARLGRPRHPANPARPARPGWARRNLATLPAGAALAFSLIGLATGPQGAQGAQGVQGERGPAGSAGKAASAPEAQAPAQQAAPATLAAEFGEGVYQVGVDIQPGLYKATVPDGESGYWARQSSEDHADIIANDLKSSGSMYLRVQPSDKYVEINGVTFHKVS